jgi:hypothetical protein
MVAITVSAVLTVGFSARPVCPRLLSRVAGTSQRWFGIKGRTHDHKSSDRLPSGIQRCSCIFPRKRMSADDAPMRMSTGPGSTTNFVRLSSQYRSAW